MGKIVAIRLSPEDEGELTRKMEARAETEKSRYFRTLMHEDGE